MARVIITQTRSRIGSTQNQRANLDALGLRKINQTVQHDDSAIIMGMLNKVKHLVKFEIVEGEKPKKAAPKKEEAPKAAEVKAEAVTEELKAEKKPAVKKAPAKAEDAAEKPAAKKAAPKKEAAPKEEAKAEAPAEPKEE